MPYESAPLKGLAWRIEAFLLRPFQAVLNNTDLVDFESQKIKALLAYLAVEVSRPHSRESLAVLFWREYP